VTTQLTERQSITDKIKCMVVKIKKEIEVFAKFLKVNAGVRYWEDATVNGIKDAEEAQNAAIPCRELDCWRPVIDIETGVITNWKKGTTADIHYKVCDNGSYAVVSDKDEDILVYDGYVPKIMAPGGNGYGDYIIMSVNEDGLIHDWLSYFFWDS